MRRAHILSILITMSAASVVARAVQQPPQQPAGGVPTFQVDPSWPRFEGNWIFGSIGGVFVDPTNDHVWVLNRPRTL